MTVNRAFGQSLCAVLRIVLKEVSNRHQTATISTIRDKRITDIRFETKRLTEKNFDNFGTFSIQKKGCCNYRFHSPFKPIQPAGNVFIAEKLPLVEEKQKKYKVAVMNITW